MTTFVKTIKLGYGTRLSSLTTHPPEKFWRVITAKNTTYLCPGDILNKTQVDDLCNSNRWDVTIVALTEGASQ